MVADICRGNAKSLVKNLGGRYSEILGINLSSGEPKEIFKWFLASVLFGTRISETIVINTYREFERQEVLSPQRILDTGWDGLVVILDAGGYARYDFKTATKLLDINKALLDNYEGDLSRLHAKAADPKDVEERLKALGKGIGDVTVNIFLREMRGIWPKAQSLPSELVILAARNSGFIPETLNDREKILKALIKKWCSEGMKEKYFADFEAALVRLGKRLRKKKSASMKGQILR
ncbi:MAG: hypothetical protein HYX62_05845 [Gammaproteobacteria bacterium]|nr:hypothetical protein [Gammaproteobacteria bacterium]